MPSPRNRKPAEKEPSVPAYKTLQGLSRYEQELVAQFGPAALPEFDADGSLSQRSTVFSYVKQVASGGRVSDPENMQMMLWRCLLIALQKKDGTVFRHIADMVEVVSHGLGGDEHFPYAYAALKAQKPPEEIRNNPILFRLWGEDFKPTNSEVLKKMRKDPNDAEAKRSLRRAKAALDLELPSGKSGRPKSKKKQK